MVLVIVLIGGNGLLSGGQPQSGGCTFGMHEHEEGCFISMEYTLS
jgi:hypothetical protein